ncbi:mitotic checkpoint serine/threonine-protein kinase BUB1 beta [Rhinophrynus dorsalis]
MAHAGDEWELSKENVQPLRQGRVMSTLQEVLSQQDSSSNTAIQQQKQAFELELRFYSGEDPLDVWDRYIKWAEQAFPQGGKESNLCPLLERAVKIFHKEQRYYGDLRYVNICIKFANFCSEPLDLYSYLHSQGIGITHAVLYITWAEEFEARGNYKKADSIFQQGIQCKAEPIDKMEVHHRQFQARVSRQALQGIMDGPDVEDSEVHEPQRSSLADLKSRGKNKARAPVSRVGDSIKQSTQGLRLQAVPPQQIPSRSRFAVFDENAALPVVAELPSLTPQTWAAPPPARAKENDQRAGPWNSGRSSKSSQQLPASETPQILPSFTPYVDESVQQQTVTPCKINPTITSVLSSRKPGKEEDPLQRVQNNSQGKEEKVMYCKNKIYAGVEEFSLEEIRAEIYMAKVRKKREEELQASALRRQEMERQIEEMERKLKMLGVCTEERISEQIQECAHILEQYGWMLNLKKSSSQVLYFLGMRYDIILSKGRVFLPENKNKSLSLRTDQDDESRKVPCNSEAIPHSETEDGGLCTSRPALDEEFPVCARSSVPAPTLESVNQVSAIEWISSIKSVSNGEEEAQKDIPSQGRENTWAEGDPTKERLGNVSIVRRGVDVGEHPTQSGSTQTGHESHSSDTSQDGTDEERLWDPKYSYEENKVLIHSILERETIFFQRERVAGLSSLPPCDVPFTIFDESSEAQPNTTTQRRSLLPVRRPLNAVPKAKVMGKHDEAPLTDALDGIEPLNEEAIVCGSGKNKTLFPDPEDTCDFVRAAQLASTPFHRAREESEESVQGDLSELERIPLREKTPVCENSFRPELCIKKLSPILEASQEDTRSSVSSVSSTTSIFSSKTLPVPEKLELASEMIEESPQAVESGELHRQLLEPLSDLLTSPEIHHEMGLMPVMKEHEEVELGCETFCLKTEVVLSPNNRLYMGVPADCDMGDMKGVALKVDYQPVPWDFYITLQLKERLGDIFETVFVGQNNCYLFQDGCINLYKDINRFSVEDIFQDSEEVIKEVIVLVAYNLLSQVEKLHSVEIVHGDLRPDTLLLDDRIFDVSSCTDMDNVLKMIDFSHSMDMKLCPTVKLSSFPVAQTEHCQQFLNHRTSSYQVDLFGIADVVHLMIFKKHLELQQENSVWKISREVPRLKGRNLWNKFFAKILNDEDPCTANILRELKEELMELFDSCFQDRLCNYFIQLEMRLNPL